MPGALVKVDQHCPSLGKQRSRGRLHQHRHRRAVPEHKVQALRRISRIQRHVRATGLENAEQPHHQIEPPLDAQRHPRIRPNALLTQVMREAVGTRIQRAIGQAVFARLHGDGVRLTPHLCFEQALHRLLDRAIKRRRVEVAEQASLLILGKQLDLRQNRLIITDQRRQQALEVTDKTLHGRLIEQRDGVAQRATHPVLAFAQTQRQVELHKVIFPGQTFQRQLAECQGWRHAAVPAQQSLEQRCVGKAAQRPGDFHHVFKRQILMRLRGQRLRFDPRQQRCPRQIARGIDAQRQGVDEHADQPFDFGAGTVGDRRADDHIGLPGQTRKQHRPGAHDHHVRRHAVALTQRLETGAGLRVQYDLDTAAAVILLRRSWTISRQAQQRRSAGQGLLPVITLALQHLAAQPAPLPYRVIRVLQGQRRQRIGLAVAERLIQRHQLMGQHAHRPAVRDDVVHRQQQHMVLIGQLHQPPTDQWIVLQIEWSARFRIEQCAQGLLGLRLLSPVFHNQRQTTVDRGNQHLCFVVQLGEPTAQGFVTSDDSRQCPLQCHGVESATQVQAQRNVVGGVAAIHLREEPQALLGERQRQCLIARCRQNRRQAAAFGLTQHFGDRRQFRVGKQIGQRQLHTQLLAHLGEHAHGQQ
ncbi:hypothetical protein D3C87_813200 [compost metagenome]